MTHETAQTREARPMTELEQLRKLLAEATPGPWKIERGKRCIQGPDTREGDSLVLTSMMGGATKWSHSPYSEYCVPGMKEGDANAALIVAAVNALPGLIARVEEMERLRAERDRAQRACEQMGARITALEISLAEMSDCQPLPKIYKYTGTAEVDVENMFDVGHRHVSGKKPYDYLKSWLSMLRPFAYATQDDSWGELEKLISIVMNNYVQILVKAETAPRSPEERAMTTTEEKLFRLEASHTSLCVRVAMLEMVLREAVELLASTHPEERWIMQHLSMLPVNNKGTGVHDERD